MANNRRTLTVRKWQLAHPEAVEAHRIVSKAKRTGALVPLPCEVCGALATGAHHDDYTKPLEVRWLCHAHHQEHHFGHPVEPSGYVAQPLRALPPGQRTPNRGRAFRRYLLPRALKMRDEGRDYRQIAEALGVSVSTIYKWINKPEYR